jgi:hypothetical protein
MRSIIDANLPIENNCCAVSVVHDKNAQSTDYCNGFIVLEKMENDQYTIETFELTIDEKGVGKMHSTTYTSADSFKEAMRGNDCYAASFDIKDPKNVEAILNKPPAPLEEHESYDRVKKPLFSFFGSNVHVLTITSFEWARNRALETISDPKRAQSIGESIPSGIEPFIQCSKHIGNVSPPDRCLVM